MYLMLSIQSAAHCAKIDTAKATLLSLPTYWIRNLIPILLNKYYLHTTEAALEQ